MRLERLDLCEERLYLCIELGGIGASGRRDIGRSGIHVRGRDTASGDDNAGHASATRPAVERAVVRIGPLLIKGDGKLLPWRHRAAVERAAVGRYGVGHGTLVDPRDRIPYVDNDVIGRELTVCHHDRCGRRVRAMREYQKSEYKKEHCYKRQTQGVLHRGIVARRTHGATEQCTVTFIFNPVHPQRLLGNPRESARLDSNQEPSRYKLDALTIELRAVTRDYRLASFQAPVG